MLNIKEELEILLVRSKIRSMRKLISQMIEGGYNIPKASTMSVQLNKQRVRFQTIQDILDYLGYELVMKKKDK